MAFCTANRAAHRHWSLGVYPGFFTWAGICSLFPKGGMCCPATAFMYTLPYSAICLDLKLVTISIKEHNLLMHTADITKADGSSNVPLSSLTPSAGPPKRHFNPIKHAQPQIANIAKKRRHSHAKIPEQYLASLACWTKIISIDIFVYIVPLA